MTSTLPPVTGFAHFALNGRSILLPGIAPEGYPDRTVRLARIEDNPHGSMFAPLIAAAPDLGNALARLVLAFNYGTDAELARSIHAAESLLTILGHPATIPGGPINPLPPLEKSSKNY